MTRYTVTNQQATEAFLEPSPDGNWVWYSDAAAELEALTKEVEAVRSAMKLIEADAIACEQEAEAFKAKNDGINAYLMSTQAMAHRLDLKRLSASQAGGEALAQTEVKP